jgi:hypothetical protein
MLADFLFTLLAFATGFCFGVIVVLMYWHDSLHRRAIEAIDELLKKLDAMESKDEGSDDAD